MSVCNNFSKVSMSLTDLKLWKVITKYPGLPGIPLVGLLVRVPWNQSNKQWYCQISTKDALNCNLRLLCNRQFKRLLSHHLCLVFLVPFPSKLPRKFPNHPHCPLSTLLATDCVETGRQKLFLESKIGMSLIFKNRVKFVSFHILNIFKHFENSLASSSSCRFFSRPIVSALTRCATTAICDPTKTWTTDILRGKECKR